MYGKTNAGSAGSIYYLGTGTSFDVSGIPGYQNLTVDNFVVSLISATASYNQVEGEENGESVSCKPTISYDATTGKVSVKGVSAQGSYTNQQRWVKVSVSAKVYLVKGDIKTI